MNVGLVRRRKVWEEGQIKEGLRVRKGSPEGSREVINWKRKY